MAYSRTELTLFSTPWGALTLSVLGILGLDRLRQILQSTYYRIETKKQVRRHTQKIIKRHMFRKSPPVSVGSFADPKDLSYFVDFLAAVGDPTHRTQLERLLTRWTRLNGIDCDLVAVPKLGNVILAAGLARRLGVGLVLIRQDSTMTGTPFLRGHPIEGPFRQNADILLVDDVASEPEFLAMCVDAIEGASGRVCAVSVIVNRIEWECEQYFHDKGIRFSPIVSVSDETLEELIA